MIASGAEGGNRSWKKRRRGPVAEPQPPQRRQTRAKERLVGERTERGGRGQEGGCWRRSQAEKSVPRRAASQNTAPKRCAFSKAFQRYQEELLACKDGRVVGKRLRSRSSLTCKAQRGRDARG